ncbi:MAG TPA: hypothetical protein PLZ93_07345 [Nocardioides sp.]|nr:hypothetical protein [Nocardioides sp.]HRD60727.1 hypothetical protein [Nocardioides sp.]HRI95411.1 hypothetical protein [Nocardioides sp.]HRK46828.1 hypothetical protein [Nocardioides sp.]
MSQDERRYHPIIAGLVALVGVGVVVGLLVSGAALAGSSMLGLGDDGDEGTTSSQQSMYLPTPVPTESASGPQITLEPGVESPSAPPSSSATPEFPISLSTSSVQVSPMEEIYLTGIYPGGEGAVVQVQRLENGTWEDFATVDAVVSGETFSTYVQTGQVGVSKFRVRDTDGPQVSNEVRVRVG